jgi:hypothetical protein
VSGWADRAVRLIARTLPVAIRDRYREEWRADAAAAREAGASPASIALGAAVFSATLDRDAPTIAGMPVPTISQRHARWALTFTGGAAAVVVGRGPFGELWLLAAITFVVFALVHLWAAARLSHGLARASATLGTAALAILVAVSTVPGVVTASVPGTRYLPSLAMVLLVAAFMVGAFAWSQRPWFFVLVAVVGAALVAAGVFLLVDATLIAMLVATASVILSRRKMRRDASPGPRSARALVVFASIGLLIAVALAALDTLVLGPQWMAGRYSLSEVYGTLPESTRVIALGNVTIWTVAAVATVIGFLVVGLVLANRPKEGDRRAAAVCAIALLALIIFSGPWAGRELFDGILYATDRLPGLRFGASPFRYVFMGVGSVALVVTLVSWIAPPRITPRLMDGVHRTTPEGGR